MELRLPRLGQDDTSLSHPPAQPGDPDERAGAQERSTEFLFSTELCGHDPAPPPAPSASAHGRGDCKDRAIFPRAPVSSTDLHRGPEEQSHSGRGGSGEPGREGANLGPPAYCLQDWG